MYVLINAPTGVLNDRCSVVGIYRHKRDAYEAMYEDIQEVLCEFDDDPDDYQLSDTHGTCYLNRSDAPEWHIFKV